MYVGLQHYLILSSFLFFIGLCGILWGRKSVLNILMALELTLLATTINLVAFSSYWKDLTGQVFTLFILTVAAAETAIGLAILVVFNRNRGSIELEDISHMRG